MNKLVSLILIAVGSSVFSQSKMNFELVQKLNSGFVPNTTISVFVKGNVEIIKARTSNLGGNFNYSAGDVAVIELPGNKIKELALEPSVTRIEAYTPHIAPMNDTMLVNCNVIPVHTGNWPLTQAYDGSGVVIGYIDTGIDFTHPDFKDSLGKSRIKFLWDQNLATAANTPLPFNYGQEWSNTEIDNGLATVHQDEGHGTNVAGIGSGNGLANGNFKGVAPKSDIIMVALDFGSSSATIIADAAYYIYSKAQALGEPCVINASLGDYMGSHDGKDLQAQLINNLINQQNGRSFIAAAGNSGQTPFHLGYTVTSDTNFTLFSYPGSSIYMQIWADTNDFKNVDFAIGADKINPSHSFRGKTNFSTISDHLGFLTNDTLYNNGNRLGVVQSYGDLIGGTYSMEFNIIPDSTSYNWRLITTGSGKFDLWNFSVVSNPPSNSTMPDSIFYKLPDKNQTIVSSFQCLDNVITVGNYTNRRSSINYNNILIVDTNRVPGLLRFNSSRGPTRDGRIKPDIAAPGDYIMSCAVLSFSAIDAIDYPDNYDPGGYHAVGTGTSAACPVIAGIAGLYLQKNPNATAMDIKQAIINCAKSDQFTGTNLPDNSYGYGKPNAFGALTNCSTDISENNLAGESAIRVFPNPSSTLFTINLDGYKIKKSDKAEIEIVNTLGELVKIISITDSMIEINSSFQSGIYFCNLIVNGIKLSSEKLVIL